MTHLRCRRDPAPSTRGYPIFCGPRTALSLIRHGILFIPICPGLYTGLSVWIKVFLSACLIRTFCFFSNSELASRTVTTIKATSSGFPTGGGTCRHSCNHHSGWITFMDPQAFGRTIMILLLYCSSSSCPERLHSTF